jgi:protein-tyrosine phosphatase
MGKNKDRNDKKTTKTRSTASRVRSQNKWKKFDMTQISPCIFLSSCGYELEHLEENKIGAILNCAKEIDLQSLLGEIGADIKHTEELKMEDVLSDISPEFNKAKEFIDKMQEKGMNVLIHCKNGVSRSAAIVTGYLMQKLHISRKKAVGIVKEKRKIANPDERFGVALTKLEDKLNRTF